MLALHYNLLLLKRIVLVANSCIMGTKDLSDMHMYAQISRPRGQGLQYFSGSLSVKYKVIHDKNMTNQYKLEQFDWLYFSCNNLY